MNQNLKIAIIKAGIRQYELALKIGSSEGRISQILRNRVRPSDEEKAKIATVLGVSVAEIFPKN